MVVGGYAVMLYAEPRYTNELDVWIEPNADNAKRVFRALVDFGAPLAGIQANDFAVPDVIYQLGVAPARIDVITSISGVRFEDAWGRRTESDFGGVPAQFLNIDDLLTNKRAIGRATDLADCERLEEAKGSDR